MRAPAVPFGAWRLQNVAAPGETLAERLQRPALAGAAAAGRGLVWVPLVLAQAADDSPRSAGWEVRDERPWRLRAPHPPLCGLRPALGHHEPRAPRAPGKDAALQPPRSSSRRSAAATTRSPTEAPHDPVDGRSRRGRRARPWTIRPPRRWSATMTAAGLSQPSTPKLASDAPANAPNALCKPTAAARRKQPPPTGRQQRIESRDAAPGRPCCREPQAGNHEWPATRHTITL